MQIVKVPKIQLGIFFALKRVTKQWQIFNENKENHFYQEIAKQLLNNF